MYKEYISPILDKLDSEIWHVNAREALHLAESSKITLKFLEYFADQHTRYKNDRLKVNVGEIEFESPVTVAAGWDKEGRAVKGLYQLGFAGVEVGSVLQYPQYGNKKPRQFVVAPGVVFNSLGFNSSGMYAVTKNLERYKNSGIPIGINIGQNKNVKIADTPYAHAIVALNTYDYASYFAIGVSSPNTPGLRDLQRKKPLTDIVQAVNAAMDLKGKRKPVFVKVAPDLSKDEIDQVAQVIYDNGLAGVIATNTTVNTQIKKKYGRENVVGGISGDDGDYRDLSNETLAHLFKLVKKEKILMGVGGVKDADTVWEKMTQGATIVQQNSAIRTVGTTLPGKENRGLIARMDREGVKNISEIIGSAVKI